MVCEIFSEQMGSNWGFIEEVGWRKGPWTSDEDRLLIEYVKLHGEGRWNSVARLTGNNYIYIREIIYYSLLCIWYEEKYFSRRKSFSFFHKSWLMFDWFVVGLRRNGKSCRLRWVNYLRPDLKRGQITPHEERIILELHSRWGNR